jgi:hypothetical protein
MAAMTEKFGAPGSLEDFERKAQLMDYVSYRAIFEGFAAHLWSQNSGRLLWMTHPAWPSNTWQIYSSDYDTPAAYYAVKKACEPLHAQLDLPDYRLAVINTTRTDRSALTLETDVLSLDNRALARRRDNLEAPANAVTTLPVPLDLGPLIERERLVLVKLTLRAADGVALSENLYWQGRGDASERLLEAMPRQRVAVSASSNGGSDENLEVHVENEGTGPALAVKITVLDGKGDRVLPVYYSDNYLMLMAGERRNLRIGCPPAGAPCARVAVRGWNVEPAEASVVHTTMASPQATLLSPR